MLPLPRSSGPRSSVVTALAPAELAPAATEPADAADADDADAATDADPDTAAPASVPLVKPGPRRGSCFAW